MPPHGRAQHMPARRFATEVVIECNDAVHLGARQVQLFRDQRRGSVRYAAERLLHRVQDRQQRAFAIIEFCNDAARALVTPRLEI